MNSLQDEIDDIKKEIKDTKKEIKEYKRLLEKEDWSELKKYGSNKEASMEWLRQQLTPLEQRLTALQEQLATLMKRRDREEAGQQASAAQPSEVSKEDFNSLKETVTKYIQVAKTIQISNMDLETLKNDGFIITSRYLEKQDFNDTSIPKFKWANPNSEPAEENKKAYLPFITECFGSKPFIKFDIPSKTLLNVSSEKLPRHLKGNTDVVFYPSSSFLVENEIIMTMELKPKDITKANLAQAIGQVIAANVLFTRGGSYPRPVGVLTDLMDQWFLIWVGSDGNIVYAATEYDSKKKDTAPITRKTALWYINNHLNQYNSIINPAPEKKRKRGQSDPTVFGFEGGILKLKPSDPDTQMEDVFDVMSKEEIQEHHLKRAMKNLVDVLPVAAEVIETVPHWMYS